MSQQYNNAQNIKKKMAFIIFLKGSIAPIVLYLDDPLKVYDNVQGLIRSTNPPKFFEIEANGPIKNVTVITADVAGCALQEEIQFTK